MEDIIKTETGISTAPTATQVGSEEEQKLVEEIRQLRAVLAESRNATRKTKGEAKAILERLTGRLHELKQVRRFASALPRLKTKLTTRRSAYDFLHFYLGSFGLQHEMRDDGILVLAPEIEAVEQASEFAVPQAAGQEPAIACAGGGDVA